MIHLGDITKLSGYEVPEVSVIVGGSPCQDLSIAGNRKGLAGERSGLFMEQLRIVKEMREKEKKNGKTNNNIRPRYMVWENVPGAFSSNKGKDFQAVLTEIVKIVNPDAPDVPLPKNGKWNKSGCLMGYGTDGQPFSIAYRLHDAQFWGVPQRRKRIALVADFGGTTAPEILFERCGVSGNIETSREKGKGTSDNTERSVGEAISFQERGGKPGGGKGILIQDEHVGALQTNNSQCVCAKEFPAVVYNGSNVTCPTNKCTPKFGDPCHTLTDDSRNYCVIGFNRERIGAVCMEDKMPTLQAAAGESGNNQPMVCSKEIVVFGRQHDATIEDISPTLVAKAGTGGNNQPMVCQPMICEEDSYCIGNGQLHDALTPSKEVSKTLNCMDDPMKVLTPSVYALDRASYNCGQNAKFDFNVETEHCQTLTSQGPGCVCASDYKGVGNQYVNDNKCIIQKAVGTLCASDYKGVGNYIVRRLTPLECERLQGYPDGWTNIGDWIDSKGKKHKGEADAPRYKALGNSIALPFWQYMSDKMSLYLDDLTMASLFDGIGGFPLVFSRSGFSPVWASEIEEFPIAVTTKRFGGTE